MCIYVDSDDIGTVLAIGYRRARKDHQCEECGRTITIGERYFHQANARDGTVERFRMCAHCRASITVGSAMTGCPENWYYGMAIGTDEWTHTGDTLTHVLPAGGRIRMLRCVVGARRKWRHRDGRLMGVPSWSQGGLI